jgi:hypothetical protein
MQIPVAVVFCFATLLGLDFSCVAQEIGAVDLRPVTSPAKIPAAGKEKKDVTAKKETDQQNDLPRGCQKLLPGMIADGIVNTEDHQLRPILVEVVKLSDKEPAEGSELEAEVRLRNTGTQNIQIPWSVDPNVTKTGQGPTGYEWEGGYFEVLFRMRNPHGVMLKSLSRDLYGTKFHEGSLLTLQPGEWVTAKIRFKLVPEYLYIDFKGQESELFARWEQVRRTMSIADCRESNAYFRYEHYYEQENHGMTIHVTGEAPKPGGEQAAKPEISLAHDIPGSLPGMAMAPPR